MIPTLGMRLILRMSVPFEIQVLCLCRLQWFERLVDQRQPSASVSASATTSIMKAHAFQVVLLGLFLSCASARPFRSNHHRQLPPAIPNTSSVTPTIPLLDSRPAHNVVARDGASENPSASSSAGNSPTAFLWMPSLPIPPSSVAPLVSTTTTTQTVLEEFTSTIYEEPTTVTVTASPATVTNTITVSEPFTATPGSFWSAPARFSNLDTFKIAHFANGERNLQITSGVPAEAVDDGHQDLSPGGDYMQVFHDQVDSWNASSALQLFYPQDSINPGNSPQGGADFYATPLPLADVSNVTLEYSVFFPSNFDWVLGGKLPGLYGGHMTCSGGDDATQCFSTRLMWRSGGAGELYLVSFVHPIHTTPSADLFFSVRSEGQANALPLPCTARVSMRYGLWTLRRERVVQIRTGGVDQRTANRRAQHSRKTGRRVPTGSERQSHHEPP